MYKKHKESKLWARFLNSINIQLIFYAFMLQLCDQFVLFQIKAISVKLNKEYKVKRILKKRIISEIAHYFIK